MAQRPDDAEMLLLLRDRRAVEMPIAGDGDGDSQISRRCPVLRDIFARNRSGHQPVSSPNYGGMSVEQTYQKVMEEGMGTLRRLGSGHAKLSDPSQDREPRASLTKEGFVRRCRSKIDDCCKRTQQDLFTLRHAGKCSGIGDDGGPCKVKHCQEKRELWAHLTTCSQPDCARSSCTLAGWQLAHLKDCAAAKCSICQPVKDFIATSKVDCVHERPNTSQQVAPSSGGPQLTAVLSPDDDMDALTSRLESMCVLLEGSSQTCETDRLLEAMSAISLDPSDDRPLHPPAVGRRGAGPAFQVMHASVAKEARNIFRVGKKGTERSSAASAATIKGSKSKWRGFRSGSRIHDLTRRTSAGNKAPGAAVDGGEKKRGPKDKSPVWRAGSKNERFMKKYKYGYTYGSRNRSGVEVTDGSQGDRDGDGRGGGGRGEVLDRNGAGGGGSPARNDDMCCMMWDGCMEGGAEAVQGSPQREGAAAKAAKSLQANIVTKRELVEEDQRKLLLLLYHVDTCRSDGDKEICEVTPHCDALRRTWRHVKACETTLCPIADAFCASITSMVVHCHDCLHPCKLCDSVRYLAWRDSRAGDAP